MKENDGKLQYRDKWVEIAMIGKYGAPLDLIHRHQADFDKKWESSRDDVIAYIDREYPKVKEYWDSEIAASENSLKEKGYA